MELFDPEFRPRRSRRLLARASTRISLALVTGAIVLGGFAPAIASDRPFYLRDANGTLHSPWLSALSAWEVTGMFFALGLELYLAGRALAKQGLGSPKTSAWIAISVVFVGTLIAVFAVEPRFETRRYHAEIEPRIRLAAFDRDHGDGDALSLGTRIAALENLREDMPLLATISDAIADRLDALEDNSAEDQTRQAVLDSLRRDNQAVLDRLKSALFAPLPFDPDYPGYQTLSPPSWQHLAGTDASGRDLLSRLVHGTRTSLGIALGATFLACCFGMLIGALAGYLGGLTDWVLSRFIEAFLCLPVLFLLVILSAFVPAQVEGRVVILTVFIAAVIWTLPARLVRAEVQRARDSDYVRSARALGAGVGRILWHHIIPNAMTPLWVSASFILGAVILIEAGLSFLGLGLHELPSWGQALRDARETTRFGDTWHLAVFPGLAVFAVVFAFNLIGDSLRDHFDPRP